MLLNLHRRLRQSLQSVQDMKFFKSNWQRVHKSEFERRNYSVA